MLLFVLVVSSSLSGQSRLDSLIALRNTDYIAGKVPTYFTPGYEVVAREYQSLLTDVIGYYENKYSKTAQVKLILLDSTQWLNEILPYGYVFYGRGWIVLNTGMNYKTFQEVYGARHYAVQLEAALLTQKMDVRYLVDAVLKFYSIHELGHYFLGSLLSIKSPDAWTGEFSASYFAYEFLQHQKSGVLKAFELFCQVNKDHYSPAYRLLEDFNTKYVGVGAENYLWYHSNFYFLVKALYGCEGRNFLTTYAANFPKERQGKLSVPEIIPLLEMECGVVQKWVQDLEGTK